MHGCPHSSSAAQCALPDFKSLSMAPGDRPQTVWALSSLRKIARERAFQPWRPLGALESHRHPGLAGIDDDLVHNCRGYFEVHLGM